MGLKFGTQNEIIETRVKQLGFKTERITKTKFSVENLVFTWTTAVSKTTLEIANDKLLTKEYFKKHGVLTPETYTDPIYPCVVKPTNKTGSKGVTPKVNSPEELEAAIKKAGEPYFLEERLEGTHYRVLVAKSGVLTIVRRIIPSVIGDGSKTVKQLLTEQPYTYPKKVNKPNYIPKVGQVFKTTNIESRSAGAWVPDVTDEPGLLERLAPTSLAARDAIPRMVVAGVDLIDTENGVYCIEVNSRPALDRYMSWGSYTPEKPWVVDEVILSYLSQPTLT